MPPSKTTTSEKTAASNKEWTPQVEIDLLMLMLTIKNAGSNHNWDAMPAQMAKLNWEFSREGLRKHFQAKMVKAFQARCNEGGLVITADADASPARSRKKGASPPAKKPAAAKPTEADGSAADGQDAEAPSTPSKKRKRAPKKKAKQETGEDVNGEDTEAKQHKVVKEEVSETEKMEADNEDEGGEV